MMRGSLLLLVCLLCVGAYAAPTVVSAEKLPAALQEAVTTPHGIYLLYYRTPAVDADLALPDYPRGLTLDSFVYHVRDRKHRDVARYACRRFTTTAGIAEVTAYFRTLLGPGMQTEALPTRTTLVAGTLAHFRMITLVPVAGHLTVREEQVEKFTIPPRVYTAEEQRVLRVVNTLARDYRTLAGLTFDAAWTAQTAAATEPPAPVLTWHVAYLRPAELTATASVGKIVALQYATKARTLLVTRQDGKTETRPLDKELTLDAIPELGDDPAMHLLLGDPLVTPATDYLALLPVPGHELDDQVQVVLTFPDDRETLRLTIDRRANTLARSEVESRDAEGHVSTMTRTYDYPITLPTTTTPLPAPSPRTAPTAGL